MQTIEIGKGSPSSRQIRKVGLAVLATACASLGAVTPGEAQDARPWVLRLEAGRSTMHRSGLSGLTFAGAAARQMARPEVRLELAVAAGSADEGFVTGTAGLEAAVLPARAVTPIAAVRLGLLLEPEYHGWVGTVGAGVRVRPGRSFAIRATVSRGIHGDQPGPHMVAAGVEVPLRPADP